MPTTLVAGYETGALRPLAEDHSALQILSTQEVGNKGRLGAAWRLRTLLGATPAVLVSMGNFGHPTVYAATRGLAAVRRIYVFSNELGRQRPVSDWLRYGFAGVLAHDAAHAIVVGARVGAAPVLRRALREGRASAVANGIDLDGARALAAAPVPHAWLTDDIPVILGIGRIRPQKNFEFLLEAFAHLRCSRPARLIILGGGSARAVAALRERAVAFGIGDEVLLAGVTDNVFAWLSRAELLALPSRYEGSANTLLEALAVGTPVVAARSAGDAEAVLGDGRWGVLSTSEDPAAFATAMGCQLGPGRVLPAGRAADFSLTHMLDAYAAIVAAAATST